MHARRPAGRTECPGHRTECPGQPDDARASAPDDWRGCPACTLHCPALVHPSERPRERLVRLGGHALLTEELLALVLGTGTARRTAVEVARDILSSGGGIVPLSHATSMELAGLPGLGVARASRLVAAFELGRRALVQPAETAPIRGPGDVYNYLWPRLNGCMQEAFWVLALDARNMVTGEIEISRGSLTGVEVHPREVFRPLIRHAAAAAVVAHNHPSGDPTPSEPDLAVTRRLRRAGDLLGIPVIDHVVIGAGGFSSIAEVAGIEDDWEWPS